MRWQRAILRIYYNKININRTFIDGEIIYKLLMIVKDILIWPLKQLDYLQLTMKIIIEMCFLVIKLIKICHINTNSRLWIIRIGYRIGSFMRRKLVWAGDLRLIHIINSFSIIVKGLIVGASVEVKVQEKDSWKHNLWLIFGNHWKDSSGRLVQVYIQLITIQ